MGGRRISRALSELESARRLLGRDDGGAKLARAGYRGRGARAGGHADLGLSGRLRLAGRSGARCFPHDGYSAGVRDVRCARVADRSEEHTYELQSLMRISYAVFCLKKKKNNIIQKINT